MPGEHSKSARQLELVHMIFLFYANIFYLVLENRLCRSLCKTLQTKGTGNAILFTLLRSMNLPGSMNIPDV